MSIGPRLIREINGFNGYFVTEDGDIIGKRGTILKPFISKMGYKIATFYINGELKHKTVHRAVAEAFVDGYKAGLTVNHKDENKLNNHYTNLEWMTFAEHNNYSKAKGGKLRGPDNNIYVFENIREFCREHKLQQSHIVKVLKGMYKQHKGWTRYEND